MKDKLKKLISTKDFPCVTISLNTHRTKPDVIKDTIVIKNLFKETEARLLGRFKKSDIQSLIDNLLKVLATLLSPSSINYNLDSLHIFVSNTACEVIRTPYPIPKDKIYIASSFVIRPIVFAITQNEKYLILLLSQSGAKLYFADNNRITSEMNNEYFPVPASVYYPVTAEEKSDSKRVDNLIREYLNKIDKSVVNVYRSTGLQCVVICTSDNKSKLLEVADIPDIYVGFALVDYNNTSWNKIANDSWEVITAIKYQEHQESLEHVLAAVKSGNVYTDLQNIYGAAKKGQGDILVMHHTFQQVVRIGDDGVITLTDDINAPDVTFDIANEIIREVIIHNGEVVFTNDDTLSERGLGQIALKTRY